MPTSSVGMSYPPESLIAEMDFAGVDRALLHRQLYMGLSNDFIADCVRCYPDRLQGLASVREWSIRSEPDATLGELERAIRSLGLSALQFFPAHLAMYGEPGGWDASGLRFFWDVFAGLGVPLFLGLGGARTIDEFTSELRVLSGWMQRYPEVKVVLTHGFNSGPFRDGDTVSIPDRVFAATPIDNPNLYLQVTFAVFFAERWDYPMPQIRPALEKLVRHFGARRLLWGSDIPVILLYWTYRQSREYIRRYCDFLAPSEMDMLMGGNMARLMGIDT